MTARSPASLRLVILISGRGSNMAAIARACGDGSIHARVAVVICDRPAVAGVPLARDLGLEAHVVPYRASPDRAAFEAALGETIDAYTPDLVILAGFMRILTPAFVARYAGRMLNIHPSLLPRYPGLHTHRRVLEAGDREHGSSVHYVTAELDGGPVVLQSRITVRTGEPEAQLSARVQATEYIIYPRVIGWIATGRLAWRNDRPWLDGQPLAAPVVEDLRDAPER
ncbi:MAG TPA: phosphoribosylglycinamide formyltransferase [Steroidobacteraceae bacterium]|nr:phosphoribosylglycinamide formyltransferase [Steroidobacteraceae bacterium]